MLTITQQIGEAFSSGAFFLTLLFNSILIYLTVYHIQNITPTYKSMIVTFALIGTFFDFWKVITKPFAHNYNSSLTMFSINQSPDFSYHFLRKALPAYGGLYAFMLSFIALQFFYRHLALKKSELLHYPKFFPATLCFCYSTLCGSSMGFLFYYMSLPDKYTDDYVREEFRRVYRLEIGFQPRYALIPFESNGDTRWHNVACLVGGSFILTFQYILILYFGYNIRINLRKTFHSSSHQHQRLEKEFFKALIIQIVLPTFFLTIPSTIFFLLPFANLTVSLETGIFHAIFTYYSPLDSFAFMYIMSEYAKRIEEMYMKYSGLSWTVQNEFQRDQVRTVF